MGNTWDPGLPASPGVHHAGGGTVTVSRWWQLRVSNTLVPGVSCASVGGFWDLPWAEGIIKQVGCWLFRPPSKVSLAGSGCNPMEIIQKCGCICNILTHACTQTHAGEWTEVCECTGLHTFAEAQEVLRERDVWSATQNPSSESHHMPLAKCLAVMISS